MIEYARAPIPDAISTGPPPAKSSTPHLYAHPWGFQIQQAIGQYTRVVQTKVKTIVGKIRARSATAPNKIPIVTAANWAWNCAKSKAEI